MDKRRRRKINGEKVFSIVASLAIVAALVVGIISIVRSATADDDKNKNYIDFDVAEKQTEGATEDETEPATEAPTKEPDKIEEPATEVPVAATVEEEPTPVAVNVNVYSFSESSSLLWPVEGEVILGFNMDKTIYFPTLDLYRCNPAIVISATTGTQILSAAPGIVEDVYDDNETGTTMVISIGNGYRLTYGQMGELMVGVGDNVEAGTVLGSVAEPSKYYSKEGSNLYFMLTKEDVAVDPMLYLIDK